MFQDAPPTCYELNSTKLTTKIHPSATSRSCSVGRSCEQTEQIDQIGQTQLSICLQSMRVHRRSHGESCPKGCKLLDCPMWRFFKYGIPEQLQEGDWIFSKGVDSQHSGWGLSKVRRLPEPTSPLGETRFECFKRIGITLKSMSRMFWTITIIESINRAQACSFTLFSSRE